MGLAGERLDVQRRGQEASTQISVPQQGVLLAEMRDDTGRSTIPYKYTGLPGFTNFGQEP
jgi:hypothetical protein